MDFDIIETPLNLGCGTTGTAEAPAVIAPLLAELLERRGARCRRVRVAADNSPVAEIIEGCCNTPQVCAACRGVESAVGAALAAGRFPIVIGGDHSIGLGSIAGCAGQLGRGNVSVVWVDAHTDIHSDKTSESHHIHGMPLGAAIGLCSGELGAVGGVGVKADPRDIWIVGARSIDPPEHDIIRENDVNLTEMSRVRELGLPAVADMLCAGIRTKAVHLSFDVDGLDAGLFTATGLPIPNGYTLAEAAWLLGELIARLPVVSFDIVEYDPELDRDGGGLRTVMEILDTVAGALCRRRR